MEMAEISLELFCLQKHTNAQFEIRPTGSLAKNKKKKGKKLQEIFHRRRREIKVTAQGKIIFFFLLISHFFFFLLFERNYVHIAQTIHLGAFND